MLEGIKIGLKFQLVAITNMLEHLVGIQNSNTASNALVQNKFCKRNKCLRAADALVTTYIFWATTRKPTSEYMSRMIRLSNKP